MILCITVENIPGIRPCTHRNEHKVTCLDHPGWKTNPDKCGGCFPREAQRGFLCQHCYSKVEDAYVRWARFERAIAGIDRAVQRDNAGVRTRQEGYVPFAGTYLALDECLSYLRSSFAHRSIEAWVSTEQGARDAIQFAYAAERAYRTHQIEEAEAKLHRVRCPQCKQLSFVRNAPVTEFALITVKCQTDGCGYTIREGAETVFYERETEYEHGCEDTCGRAVEKCPRRRTVTVGWETVVKEKIDVIDALETRRRA